MKNPLKVAAWAGLISLIIGVLMLPFYFFAEQGSALFLLSLITSMISVVLGIFFFNGYLVLARKYKNTLLTVMAWIGISFMILSFVLGLLGGILALAGTAMAADENVFANPQISEEDVAAVALIFIIVWVFIALIMGAYTILFGVAILKMKKDLKYARAAGVWNIVAGATYIIFVGMLIKFVAYIFEILMFFKASEKLEKKRKV